MILDKKVIEFYKSIKQSPQNADQKTTIEIPEKFRNEVVELISKLNGNAQIVQA